MIWWIWTAFRPSKIYTFDVCYSWTLDDPDVYWLGEGAWVAITDNMGIGLK